MKLNALKTINYHKHYCYRHKKHQNLTVIFTLIEHSHNFMVLCMPPLSDRKVFQYQGGT